MTALNRIPYKDIKGATELASWVIRTIGLESDKYVEQQADALFRYICVDLGLMDTDTNTSVLPVCTSDKLCAFVHSVIHSWVSTPYIWSVLTSYTGLDRHRVRFECNPGRLLGLVVWAYVLEHGVQYLDANPQQANDIATTWLARAESQGGDIQGKPENRELSSPCQCVLFNI